MDQRPDSLFHNIVHERKSKADESSTLFFFVSFFLFLLLFIFFFYLLQWNGISISCISKHLYIVSKVFEARPKMIHGECSKSSSGSRICSPTIIRLIRSLVNSYNKNVLYITMPIYY